jgi:hypothetical protein
LGFFGLRSRRNVPTGACSLAASADISVNRFARRSLRGLEWQTVEKGLQQLAGTPFKVLRRHYLTAAIRDAYPAARGAK